MPPASSVTPPTVRDLLADAADLASSPVPSASAPRESNYYGATSAALPGKLVGPPRELRAAGHRCRLCFASDEEARLEVHHRTYRNFGCELAEDLTTLCHDCHLHVTCMERARKVRSLSRVAPSHVRWRVASAVRLPYRPGKIA